MTPVSKAAVARVLSFVLCVLTLAAMGLARTAHAQDPTVVLGVPQNGGTYAASLTLLFVTDGTNVVCSLDGQPFAPCSSGAGLSGLANGPHTFVLTASDDAGRTTTVAAAFFVDAVPPLIADVQPQGLNGRTVLASFASSDRAEDGTVFLCDIDGQRYEPCSPGVAVPFADLFDGPHLISISATDAAGNSSQVTSPFVVDGVGPVFDTASDVSPTAAACPRSTTDTQISFRAVDARGSDPVRYSCGLDVGTSADFTPCNAANPLEPTFGWRCLADGQHTLTVIAFDRFNNTSDPHSFDFSVARSAGCPVNACAGPDRHTSELGTVMFDASLSTAASVQWSQIAGPSASFDPSALNPSVATPPLPGRTGTQVLTFQLTATGNGGTDSDTVDIIVKNTNLAPVADAGGDQAVREGSRVTLSAALSYDPDTDALAGHEWVQTEGAPVQLSNAGAASPTFTAPLLSGGLDGPEVLAFQVRVFDDLLFSAPDEVRVSVEQVNHAAAVDAGGDQTKLESSTVTLRGTASDPDGDPLRFSWAQTEGVPVVLANANTLIATFTAPEVSEGGATLAFRLTATDGGLEGADDVLINVRKRSDPPSCHLARPSKPYLWPPNHTLLPVTVEGITDPDSPSFAIRITGVRQDEPVNGTGDGDTDPDAVIQESAVLLRAERDGGGNGRVYQIAFTADDGLGGVCTGSVYVAVPQNARATSVVNDGLGYDSTAR